VIDTENFSISDQTELFIQALDFMNPKSADIALSNALSLKGRVDTDVLPSDAFDRFLLTRMYARNELNRGWNDRTPSERVVVNGGVFVQSLLPFSEPLFDGENANVEGVNPLHVLAGAYSHDQQSSAQPPSEVADWLDAQSDGNEREGAHYVQIGDFSLYVASEGKNRVDLYRKLERPIVARVFKSSYPSSNQLQLVRLFPFGGVGLRYIGERRECAARLQAWQFLSKNVAALPFPESVQMLEAYGVQWGKSEWSLHSRIIERKVKLYVCRRKYIP